MQGFHLDSVGGGAQCHCNIFFEDFVLQIVHVGATSDLRACEGGKNIPVMAKVQFLLYITTITMNVSKNEFCM